MNIFRNISLFFAALLAFTVGGPLAMAQTQTPSTTLCAAQTAAATTICLTSTTGVVNQTGVYVGGELELVLLSASQTIASSNAYVPVARAQRAGTVPTAHNNGDLAWLALTPGQSLVPGVNGFRYSTQFADVGPCTAANEVYLPHIWPDLNAYRDCQNSLWVDFNQGLEAHLMGTPLSTIAASGALGVGTGEYVITKSSAAAALTLAAPTSGVQDGTVITITSSTAQAHTITATGLFQTGGTTVNTATFAAHAGASLTIMAYQGKWVVLSSNAITFS